MYRKTESAPITFFSETNKAVMNKKYVDFNLFKIHTLSEIKKLHHEEAYNQWNLFCNHIQQFSTDKSEKLLLMQVAFSCLDKPAESGELSQLITLMRHLKSVYGLQMIHTLLKAEVAHKERTLQNYLYICQLLLDLREDNNILKIVKGCLPHLSSLLEKLRLMQEDYLTKKYPERDLDTVIQRFAQKDALVQFPLEKEELAQIKLDYLAIGADLSSLKSIPQDELAKRFKAEALQWREKQSPHAKCLMLAILAETIRRQYGISPYDTQLIAILALLNNPETLKGRIGQIKTGEGKSTIIAMLNAFMAGQGYFVDMVTSSSYLASRDCKKYQPFYQALDLSASHICHYKQRQEHFHAQILYGTNTDFEFALLRDGLYTLKLRYSCNQENQLILRPFDVVIIDEVDNLFLDTALNSAQLGITDYTNIAWIYSPILQFAQSKSKEEALTEDLIQELRVHINTRINNEEQNLLKAISDKQLMRWYKNAYIALYEKKENRDYLIRAKKEKHPDENHEHLDITIVDYANTGRTNQGSQWQHGIHQFLQLKHGLKLTAPTKTGASISHPAYFNKYQHIFGLTGTMGETTEREEIQKIYSVGSFDAPPAFPSLRKRHPDYLTRNQKAKWNAILAELATLQKQGQPALVLFKTIEESNNFSKFLRAQLIKHQVLNETQKEAEDYVVGQAGESGIITIATNTAGRGTDILLSPESKEAGGLEVIFSFYPDNLRVENQGLGRAGRQGQPGGARMILSLEDETIVQLVQIDHPLSLLFKVAALQHSSAQEQSNQNQPADDLIAMLQELRSFRIKQESEQRIASSQQEQLFYEKLNDFFVKLSGIYNLVESEEFNKTIEHICRSNLYYEQTEDLFDRKNPNWQDLHVMAHSLLEKQVEGIIVDWCAFIERFKETYLLHIRDLWASYYSKLKDEIEVDSQDKAKKLIHSFLNTPLNNAEAIVHAVLAAEVQVLAQQRNTFMM